jgi:hypothetical protein
MESVLPDCVMKEISFLTPFSIPIVGRLTQVYKNPLRTYREWMIGCKAFTYEGERITYYVSRAVRKNRAFLFFDSGIEGRVAPYNILANVSVIDEIRAENAPQSFLGADNDVED